MTGPIHNMIFPLGNQSVRCPKCGAAPGESCTGKHKGKSADVPPHLARQRAQMEKAERNRRKEGRGEGRQCEW